MIANGATIHALAGLLTASYADHLPPAEADMMRAAAVRARDEHDAMRDRIFALEGHREQWRRIAYRYRDALAEIGGPVALTSLADIDETLPTDTRTR